VCPLLSIFAIKKDLRCVLDCNIVLSPKEEKQEAISLATNRHHFKEIEFYSSLTEKNYYSKTNEDGTLGIYEKETNKEIPNNSKPSKRQILYSALEELEGDLTGSNTLYQLEHKLEKLIDSRK
jgi:hypothetical protein